MRFESIKALIECKKDLLKTLEESKNFAKLIDDEERGRDLEFKIASVKQEVDGLKRSASKQQAIEDEERLLLNKIDGWRAIMSDDRSSPDLIAHATKMWLIDRRKLLDS